jgi:hypothetical protein
MRINPSHSGIIRNSNWLSIIYSSRERRTKPLNMILRNQVHDASTFLGFVVFVYDCAYIRLLMY